MARGAKRRHSGSAIDLGMIQMSRKCWANALGGCDTLSGEHVVSQSVLRQAGGAIGTEGMMRVPDGRKSVSALKSNILCRKHNAELSPLDAEAGRLMAFLRSANSPTFEGALDVDGATLERWALKTTVNSVAAGWSDEARWMADLLVVKTIFGAEPVPPGCGLYLVETARRHDGRPLEFSFGPLWTDPPESKQLAGATIGMNGLSFFVATIPHIVDRFAALAKPGDAYASHRYVHHPQGITIHREGASSLPIRLRWA